MTTSGYDNRTLSRAGMGRTPARPLLQPPRLYEVSQQLSSQTVVGPDARRRSLFGLSTALWSSRGQHAVERGWWKALSGLRSVNQNVILCHGADPELVTRSLDIINGRSPGVIELAGPALSHAKVLCDAGMVCIGSSPFMVLEDMGDRAFDVDPDVTEAGPDDLPAIWDLLAMAFGYTPEMAKNAVPPDVFSTPGQSVWTLSVDGMLCSSVTTVNVGSTLAAWSMGTAPAMQRHGYGRRLLPTVLAMSASRGVSEALLLASPAGEPVYRDVGFRVVEHWQQWSHPRWMWAFTPS